MAMFLMILVFLGLAVAAYRWAGTDPRRLRAALIGGFALGAIFLVGLLVPETRNGVVSGAKFTTWFLLSILFWWVLAFWGRVRGERRIWLGVAGSCLLAYLLAGQDAAHPLGRILIAVVFLPLGLVATTVMFRSFADTWKIIPIFLYLLAAGYVTLCLPTDVADAYSALTSQRPAATVTAVPMPPTPSATPAPVRVATPAPAPPAAPPPPAVQPHPRPAAPPVVAPPPTPPATPAPSPTPSGNPGEVLDGEDAPVR